MTLDRQRVAALRDCVQKTIDEGRAPAAQFALAQNGELLEFETLGEANNSDRFCLFSATKPVVAALVWQLMGEGLLDLADRVTDVWPEFGAHGKHAITLEHVLLHMCGFPNATIDQQHITTREARAAQMQDWTLQSEPGSRYEYHATSAHWVLTELVARVTGQDFRSALRTRVLDPLGVDRLEVGVPTERQGDIKRCVITGEYGDLDALQEILGVTVDASMLEAMLGDGVKYANDAELVEVGVPGASGISDAAQVALFYQGLLHNPDEIWRPKVLRKATGDARDLPTNPLPDNPQTRRTVGLCVAGSDMRELSLPSRPEPLSTRLFGRLTSPRTFGHPGAGGQIAWADPESGLSFAFLTNGMDRDTFAGLERDTTLSTLAARCVKV
ncbi:serine hydrolase domain-containing protein [Streptomyces fractus]|uniref:serine hydrolase domain-containing protein n=1 Tax=Streptomyces fractus TaxID=641806 RepID=UPI003CE7FE4D